MQPNICCSPTIETHFLFFRNVVFPFLKHSYENIIITNFHDNLIHIQWDLKAYNILYHKDAEKLQDGKIWSIDSSWLFCTTFSIIEHHVYLTKNLNLSWDRGFPYEGIEYILTRLNYLSNKQKEICCKRQLCSLTPKSSYTQFSAYSRQL